jgi:hypothetical protein
MLLQPHRNRRVMAAPERKPPMDAVSIYDHIIVAIREGRLNKEEVKDIIQELYAGYPEMFEEANLEGLVNPPDAKDYDERLPDRDMTNQRPY